MKKSVLFLSSIIMATTANADSLQDFLMGDGGSEGLSQNHSTKPQVDSKPLQKRSVKKIDTIPDIDYEKDLAIQRYKSYMKAKRKERTYTLTEGYRLYNQDRLLEAYYVFKKLAEKGKDTYGESLLVKRALERRGINPIDFSELR